MALKKYAISEWKHDEFNNFEEFRDMTRWNELLGIEMELPCSDLKGSIKKSSDDKKSCWKITHLMSKSFIFEGAVLILSLTTLISFFRRDSIITALAEPTHTAKEEI
jgi:hypothetical protein